VGEVLALLRGKKSMRKARGFKVLRQLWQGLISGINSAFLSKTTEELFLRASRFPERKNGGGPKGGLGGEKKDG